MIALCAVWGGAVGVPAWADCSSEAVRWQRWAEVAQPLMRQAPARVEALETAKVASDVGGRLVRLPVRVGDRVAAGALLAEIDATGEAANLREAQAALASAQTRLLQARRLRDQAERLVRARASNEEAVRAAEETVQFAEAEVALRTAQVAKAEWRLSQSVVRAPFAGVVTARLQSEGSWVAAGQPLVVLLPTASEIAARVPLTYADELRRAEAAPNFVAPTGAPIPVVWVGTNGEVDAAAQLVTVRLRPAAPAPVTPGQVGVLRWQAPIAVVPPAAVTARAGQVGVWLRQRQAEPHFVFLPNALPGRAAAVELPAGFAVEETEVAVAGQGALAWQAVAGGAGRECR